MGHDLRLSVPLNVARIRPESLNVRMRVRQARLKIIHAEALKSEPLNGLHLKTRLTRIGLVLAARNERYKVVIAARSERHNMICITRIMMATYFLSSYDSIKTFYGLHLPRQNPIRRI